MSICKVLIDQINSNLENILSLRRDFVSKSDGSYVSKGDLLVQSIINDELKKILPNHILISEENTIAKNSAWDNNKSYVILDPIDGTENFVSGLREWGVGLSIYNNGIHSESCIFLPELSDFLITGMKLKKYESRVIGLSSSLTRDDILNLPKTNYEYRIIGCSMYNTLAAIKGSFKMFENVKGVNCWDILPGLNLALEHGCYVECDRIPYCGQVIDLTKKYKIRISNR